MIVGQQYHMLAISPSNVFNSYTLLVMLVLLNLSFNKHIFCPCLIPAAAEVKEVYSMICRLTVAVAVLMAFIFVTNVCGVNFH